MRLTLEKTELQHSQQELQIQVEEQAAEMSELQNRLIRLAEENALVYDDLAIGGLLAQIFCRV
jgi:predicted nuclease with TOPRIM domain